MGEAAGAKMRGENHIWNVLPQNKSSIEIVSFISIVKFIFAIVSAKKNYYMALTPRQVTPPDAEEQQLALSSYDALKTVRDQLGDRHHPSFKVTASEESFQLPRYALDLLLDILRYTGKGRAVTVIPETAEMTTQAAANFLGCSRPHLVKLLEAGTIPYHKVGKHRRIQVKDLATYKERLKAKQRALLSDMMRDDEAAGLYDT